MQICNLVIFSKKSNFHSINVPCLFFEFIFHILKSSQLNAGCFTIKYSYIKTKPNLSPIGKRFGLVCSGTPRRQGSCSNGFAAGKNASLSCERSGLAAAGGRALKTTIQVVFATDSLMLSRAILLPGCSRPTCCIV